MNRGWIPALTLVLLVAGCGEPPNKEIDQAQGAIDAARAAGADRYATTEFTAATSAMQRAEEAVGQRDYRLALNNALESREQAQNAARVAADTKAALRGDVERSMAEIAALLARANGELQEAERARVARRSLAAAQQILNTANDDVQKAGAAMKADDYLAANRALGGVQERIQQAIDAIGAVRGAQGSRRPR